LGFKVGRFADHCQPIAFSLKTEQTQQTEKKNEGKNMAGLGLQAFLNHDKESGKRKFFKNWKKEDGHAVLWLSTRAEVAYPTHVHSFITNGVFEDKKTGEERQTLFFPRFVSPDPEVVHTHQYFRDDDKLYLQIPPIKDPFLLLREYLRNDCPEMPLSQPIFKWYDHKNRQDIIWTRGTLSRLVEKTKTTWNHSLDSKLEYLFVIVDDNSPSDGAQIVRGSKSIGDKMRTVIREQMDSNGEKGNPMLYPYAFKWVYDKDAKKFDDTYRVFRFNKSEMTPAIREAIESTDFPDPTVDCQPRPGDKAKIRTAFEDAAEVDLPWEKLFVDEWDDGGEIRGSEKKTESKQDRVQEVSGVTRSRKEPEAKQKIEMIDCDQCGSPMPVTSPKCENCGEEYEVSEEEISEPTTSKTNVDASTKKPEEKKAKSSGDESCWSCGSDDVSAGRCQNCGIEISEDEIPF
jgi:DNA-directed RNA polymerase subunit M/transcription elongation factor TFIIS